MFGGTGFLGLGGTGFGDFITNTTNTIESAVSRGAEFVSRLPNDLISAGQNLGNQIFDTDAPTQQQFIEQGREFRAQQAGGSFGSFINQNFSMIAFFGAFIALVAMLSKK